MVSLKNIAKAAKKINMEMKLFRRPVKVIIDKKELTFWITQCGCVQVEIDGVETAVSAIAHPVKKAEWVEKDDPPGYFDDFVHPLLQAPDYFDALMLFFGCGGHTRKYSENDCEYVYVATT